MTGSLGTMRRVELSAGPIDYVDTGGDGPVLVFTHGVPMNETQWRRVVPLLEGYRCVLPTLPLGAHRQPMKSDADLSHHGVALLLDELIRQLDLHEVTLVVNDWGGPQFLVAMGRTERLARLVLVACEAFDNFPPAPAKALATVARVPGGIWLLMQLLRLRWFRHSPRGYGGMSLRGVPDDVMDDWFAPATRDRRVRRDFAKFAISAPPRAELLAASKKLETYVRPVLVVWAADDNLMPRPHGRLLANSFPKGRLVEIADSATLVPEDQPERLAGELIAFLIETGAPPRDGG